MSKRLFIAAALLLGASVLAWSQRTGVREEVLSDWNKSSGLDCVYDLSPKASTPAPKGYEAVYISHYGRHGSRYMTSDKHYRRLRQQLDSALALGILTEYGKDVRIRILTAAADAKGRAGLLTDLGARQHRAIARRMFDNYPELMGQPLTVTANATTSRRVIKSMQSFCGELAELNPAYTITMDAREEDHAYLKSNKSIPVPDSPTDDALYRKLKAFKQKMLSGDPQMKALFTDPEQAKSFIDPFTFADDLYYVAADMYCLPELHLRFDDLFGEDGMIDGFRAYNASWCLWEGLMPGAKPSWLRIYPLLENFLDEADAMIASGGSGLRLRFGHDSVVLPFAYVLGFPEATGATDDMENLHLRFSIFRLIPMAANIQLVFYRKSGSRDILVKFLMNENETAIPLKTDCYPYYHWSDVKRYYRDKLKDAQR